MSQALKSTFPRARALLEGAARREGRGAEAVDRANEAALGFARLGYPLLEAQALEVAGRVDDAIVLYRGCGAAGDVKRLDRSPAASAVSLEERSAERRGNVLSVRER